MMTSEQMIPCSVAGISLCIDMNQVVGVERGDLLGDAYEGAFLSGPMGDVPVEALADLLGMPAPSTLRGRKIVIVSGGSGPRGLIVDDVRRAIDVPTDRWKSLAAVMGRASAAIPAAALVDELLLLRLSSQFLAGDETNSSTPSALPAEELENRRPASRETRMADRTPEGPASESGKAAKVVLFQTVGSSRVDPRVTFVLSVTQIYEIADCHSAVTIPLAPAHISGLAVWRESPLPMVDFDRCFGLPAGKQTTDPARMLVIRTPADGLPVGVLAEGELRGITLPMPRQETGLQVGIPPGLDSRLIRAAFQTDSGYLVIPDLTAILALAPSDAT